MPYFYINTVIAENYQRSSHAFLIGNELLKDQKPHTHSPYTGCYFPNRRREGEGITCPPDGFKHKKTKSNSLKDCIHHWLPITETKLISQDDASGTTTQLSTMEPQALWNVLSQQRALWIYRSRSAAFQSLFGKAFPSLPDQQTLCSNLNLLYSSHLNC